MARKKTAPVELVKPANMTVENRELALDILHPHPRNYNRHNASQLDHLCKSLTRFGQVRSIVVWRNPADELLYILAGHGVTEAAKRLGWKRIRADVIEGCDEIVALAYVVADNEHARESDPDKAALALIIDEVSQFDADLLDAMSYDDDKFAALLAEVEAGIDGYGDGAGTGEGSGAGEGGGAGGSEGGGDGGGGVGDDASDHTPKYGVIVLCENEDRQTEVYGLLEEEGYAVRKTALP